MIGLDTNVLVRLFVRDDESQAEAVGALAGRLTPDDPGFLGREVLVELVWVLRRAYGFDRQRIAALLDDLLNLENVQVESAEDVAEASYRYGAGGADFADLMILSAARRVGATLFTFDRKLAGQPGAALLRATQADEGG